MLARVYINKHIVASNKKRGENKPTISIRTYKKIERAKEVIFTGKTILKQDFSNPICSGANIWIETDRESILIVDQLELDI